MENKSNVIIVLLAVLIGIIAGVGLLTGINSTIGGALRPLYVRIVRIDRTEKSIEDKLAQIQNKINTVGFNAQQPQMPPSEDMNKVYAIAPGVSPILGNRNAPATIVEFSDFQCPFCGHFYSVI